LLSAGFSGFVVHQLQTFCYTAIAVIGLNLLLGFSGQMSLGHAGFFAIGAYGSAITSLRLNWPIYLSIPFGTVLSFLAGAFVGVFALRTRGLYLAMTTLAFGFIVDIAAQRWVDLTGGTMGLMLIPQVGGNSMSAAAFNYLALCLMSLLLVQMATDFISETAPGRSLRALRESEIFAATVGLNVPIWRAATFAFGSACAGLAGSLFAHQSGFIGSDAFTVRLSVALLIAAVIGGLGTRSGPLLGTAILLVIVETIAGQEKFGLICYGLILLFVLLLFPEGAAGALGKLSGNFASRAKFIGDSVGQARLPFSQFYGLQLEVKDLVKRYQGVTAVDRASFKVKAGSVHGLIGPNGAGKSTVINIIAGVYRHDGGSVILGDVELGSKGTAQRAKLGLARTFQNMQLIQAITVVENVMLGIKPRRSLARTFFDWLSLNGCERSDIEDAFRVLRFLGIDDTAQKLPREISFGHSKLVELARAIAQEPVILLLDEPIAGLNTAEARRIAEAIRHLKLLGVTILLVEHNMEFVMSLCDEVSVLHYGRLIATGTPAEIQANEAVIAAYLGAKTSTDD
jgi:ABC-type branched-subunit amino acid transport system ATPase component/ABC-type branched-subunit amino acid transport system permease subunit